MRKLLVARAEHSCQDDTRCFTHCPLQIRIESHGHEKHIHNATALLDLCVPGVRNGMPLHLRLVMDLAHNLGVDGQSPSPAS